MKKEIVVKKRRWKPNLPVTYDEISADISIDSEKESDSSSPDEETLGNEESDQAENKDSLTITLKNKGIKKIRKVKYVFSVKYEVSKEISADENKDSTEDLTESSTDETVTETLTGKYSVLINKVAPGDEKSSSLNVEGKIVSYKIKKIELYSGKALYVHDENKDSYTLKWGVPDTVPPKFSGSFLKSKSKCNGSCVMVVYSDKKSSFNFKKFITASDDRTRKVKIKVDTSKINWKKTGTYKVKYTATDKAGNKAKTWRKIYMIKKGTAEDVADRVLSSIISSKWSDTSKAKAIYRYIRSHVTYIQHASHPSWRTAGARGIIYGSGDCYTCYSVSRLLLTRAGIPNMMIKRYPVYSARHYWNLCYVSGGWYHFDTTMRSSHKTYCLLTDSQMHAKEPGNTFAFNTSLYPKRATKKISY